VCSLTLPQDREQKGPRFLCCVPHLGQDLSAGMH